MERQLCSSLNHAGRKYPASHVVKTIFQGGPIKSAAGHPNLGKRSKGDGTLLIFGVSSGDQINTVELRLPADPDLAVDFF
jgi:hypothetical protein